MPDPIDWQARCLAAEVALERIVIEVGDISCAKEEEIRDDYTSGESQGWRMASYQIGTITPDLTAARELVRKAGEAEKFAEKQPISSLTPRDGTVILGWSKEWALGSMLMRVNYHGVWSNLNGDAFPDAPTHWAPIVSWPGWIDGGHR